MSWEKGLREHQTTTGTVVKTHMSLYVVKVSFHGVPYTLNKGEREDGTKTSGSQGLTYDFIPSTHLRT